MRPAARFDTIASVTPPDRLRPIVSAGIFICGRLIMSKTVPFTKKPKANDELADLLISRNLVADRDKTIHLLDSIGYYRLTGYLVPFRMPGTDNYLPGTTLDKVWDTYTFDRHLRLTAMDALARIEIAVRALIVKFHTASNSDPFAYVNHANLPGITAKQHTSLLSHIAAAQGDASLLHQIIVRKPHDILPASDIAVNRPADQRQKPFHQLVHIACKYHILFHFLFTSPCPQSNCQAARLFSICPHIRITALQRNSENFPICASSAGIPNCSSSH